MGTKAKLSTKVISIFLSALMVLSCAYAALPALAPKVKAATAEETAWQNLSDAFSAALNGGYLSTKDWSDITSADGVITITDGTVNGYAYAIVAALGELIALIGEGKHNSELRETVKTTLAGQYNLTLNTYQETFLDEILDVSGKYGTYTPDSVWNGTEADMKTNLTSQTVTVTAERSESAAILSSFNSIDDIEAAGYKVEKTYTIKITAEAVKCAPTVSGTETGAYYANTSIKAAGEKTDITADAKTNLQNIKAYLTYVNGSEFKPYFDAWYNNGGAVNTSSLYAMTTEQVADIEKNYDEVYANVEIGDAYFVEEFIGRGNYELHQSFVDAAVKALSVINYKDYIAWLVNGAPLGNGTRNRDDYKTSDPSSIAAVIGQASAFREGLSSADSSVLANLKNIYAGFDPDGEYDVNNSKTYYMNFDNFIRYMSSLLYNFYLQEIKAAASTLLNNGASTTYTFSNETSDFFNLISGAVGSGYQTGTNYVLTSDTRIDTDKTYYTPDATYSYALTSDTELDGSKRYFSNWQKVENPVEADLGSYYEDVEVDSVHSYEPTSDTSLNAAKTYYVQSSTYTVVTSPSVAYISTYSERTSALYKYQKTADTVIMNGKTYYTLSGSVYTEVEEPVLDDIGTYYEIVFRAVENPTAAYLFDYYELVGSYYGLKGVGKGEYISSNYVDVAECPITDTDLIALSAFFDAAVKMIDEADKYGVNVNNYMDETLLQQIRDMSTLLSNEQISRGRVTQKFLEDYRAVAELMSGYIKGGKSLQSLYNDLTETVGKRNTFRSTYSWFKDDPRDAAMSAFIDELYNELYDRIQSQYIEIQNLYKEYNGVNVRTYYQLRTNIQRINDINSIISYLNSNIANVSGVNFTGLTRNAGNLSSLYYNASTGKYASSGTSYATIVSQVNGFTMSSIQSAVSSNRYTHGNITRTTMDADWVHNKNFTAYFTTNSTPSGGNYASVGNTVTKLDSFLKSEDLINLLGADEQGKGITTLTEYIKDILAENLFSDQMLDTVLGLLFPLLTSIFDQILPEMLAKNIQNKNVGDLAGDTGDVVLQGGRLWFYFNGYTTAWEEDANGNIVATFTGGNPGSHLTNTFATLTANKASLYIYPSTLGNYFSTITTSAGITQAQANLLHTIGNAIKAVGDQTMTYTTYKDRNAWDKFKNADGKYEFNGGNGFNWGVDSQTTFDGKYSQFKSMLGAMLSSAITILRALFGNQNFTLSLDGNYNNGGNLLYGYIQDLTVGYDVLGWGAVKSSDNWLQAEKIQADAVIAPLNLYRGLWIPLMEDLLGMNMGADGVFTWSVPSVTGNFTGPQLAGYLLDPIYQLILAVSANPVQSVCKLLPNIAYHLLDGTIDNYLDININISLSVKDLDITDAGGGLAGDLLNWNWVKNLVLSIAADALKFNIPVALGEMLNLEDLLGFGLNDLNTILTGVLGMISEGATNTLPGIGTGRLATMFKDGGFRTNASTNGVRPNGRTRTYVVADTEFVFYGLFSYIFRAVQQKGGLANILSLVESFTGSSLGDSLPSIVYALVEGIESADLAFAALIELLNEPKYDVATFNWYQVDGSSNQPTINWNTTTFTYLEYSNKWTKEKAKYIYDNMDNIVNAIVNMISPETLADYDGSVDVWLSKFINSMFTNKGVMNVIDLVTMVGDALKGSNGIVKLLRQQITSSNVNDPEMNLFAWYNVFGYLYEDYHNVTLETNQFIAYNVIANQVYVYEAVPNDESVEVVDLTQTGTFTWDIVQAYPVAPGETVSYQINGQTFSRTAIVPYNTSVTTDKYQVYENLFSNVRWSGNGTDLTWEVKLTSDIIGHLTDNGTTLKRVGSEGAYTGYTDEGVSYSVGSWYPLVDGGSMEDPSSDNARAVFTAIFSELIGPFSNIFSFVLRGTNLSLFGNNLTIQGYSTYNNAVIPLLEAFGVYGLKTQAEFDALASANGTRAAFDYIVNELFGALDDLLTDDRVYDASGNVVSGKGPFQKLVDILPHLYYFLQSDGMTVVLKNLLMFVWQLLDTLRPIVNIDLDNVIHALLCRMLGLVYDENAAGYETNLLTSELLGMLGIEAPTYTSAAGARDKAKVESIFKFSLKNLTLQGIYSLVNGITGLNLYPLVYALEGMCQTSAPIALGYNAVQTEPYTYTSYTVPNTATTTYRTYTVNFSGQDTITLTISALIDIIKYEGNAAALDEMLGTITELVPGAGNLLTGEGIEGLIQALIAIMDDAPYGVEIERPNWDYIFEGKNVIYADGNQRPWEDIVYTGETLDITADRWAELYKLTQVTDYDFGRYHDQTLYNLEYLTSWTEDVAKSTYGLLEGVLDYVVSLLGDSLPEELAGASTFSELVSGLLTNMVFTPDLMIQLLDLLANVYTYIPDELLGAINALLTDNAADGAVIDMFAWREEGYIVNDYPWNDDGTQDTTAEKIWQANREHDWFTPGSATYIDSESAFIAAIGELLAPAGTLFSIIFLNEDYNMFNSLSKNSADKNDSLVVNGTAAYATALIPLLEALGLDLTGYEPEKYNNGDGTYNGAQFIKDLVTIVDTLLNDVIYGPVGSNGVRSGGPVKWIIKNLPNIIYFINAGGIKASINNVFGAVKAVVDAIGTIIDLPFDLHNLFDSGLDLTNLTMQGLFGMVYSLTKSYNDDGSVIPGLYMSDSLMNYISNIYIGKIEAFTSANGYQSFRMVYSNTEEEHDMITILLAIVLEYATDSGTFIDNVDSHGNEVAYNNADALDRLLFSGSDMEGLIGQVIGALRNPEALAVTDMNWNYFDEEFDLSAVEDHPIRVDAYAYRYLNWTTQWTYTKAETAANEFEDLILEVLKMVMTDDETIQNAEDLGGILSIDSVFSADILTSVLDLLTGLLYGENSILNEDLVSLIGYILGGDFSQWDGRYSFATVSELPADAKTETVAGIAGNVIYYTENEGVTQYLIREGNQKDFIAGLVKVLMPASGLIGWLLFGQDYTFFNPHDSRDEYLLSIPGSNGYKDGLALVLEALGCDSTMKYSAAYIGHTDEFIYDLANSVADKALAICSDPVNEIVGLIPELIYFINAGGLQHTVTGLLSGLLGLVNQISALAPAIQDMLDLPETVTSATDEESQYALIEMTIDSLLKSVFADQGYTVAVNPDGTTDIDFTLTGINLKYVFNILEVVTGMEISDVIGNSLDKFVIGEIHAYDSKAGDIGAPVLAYKMTFGSNSSQGTNDSFADFITILLSAVVDLIEYQDDAGNYLNVHALAVLLGFEEYEGLIAAVVGLLKDSLNSEILPIDWFYFSDALSRYTYNEATGELTLKDPQPEITEGSLTEIPESAINYLTYASDWTEETANYIVSHFSEIIDGVLGMFVTGESNTLADIINDSFSLSNDVFTYENYSSVVTAVSGLAEQIPTVVNTLLNIALELDLTSLGSLAMLTEEEYNALNADGRKNAFVSAIIAIVTPLRPIVEWFFFNQALTYFDKDTGNGIEKLISIGGASGYNDALVPLLEALGVDCPSYTVSDEDTTAQKNVKFGNFISLLIEKVLMRVEEILSDPADAAINLLPNLIYFINTNAVATILNNLVAPIIALVNAALPVLISLTEGDNLDGAMKALKDVLDENNITESTKLTMSDVIEIALSLFETDDSKGDETVLDYLLNNINFNKLDLTAILTLVEGILAGGFIEIGGTKVQANIKIVDVVGAERIENFYLNDIEYFLSASGKAAFRMPGSADMITVIVNFLLEVLLYQNGSFSNAAEIDKVLGGNTVQTVVNLILGLRDIQEVDPADINWNYWDESQTLGDGITIPNHKFVYLNYANQWSFEKAVYIDTGLADIVEQVLILAGVEDGDISAIINNAVNLADFLNADTLNSVLSAINGLFNGDINIPDALLNVLGLILNINVAAWDGSYVFADAAPEGTSTALDSTYGLRYYVTDNIKHYIINTTKTQGGKTVADYSDFASGLQIILEPAQGLLGWLLLGDTIGFFVKSEDGNVDENGNRLDNELIRVPGSNGYDTGLVLLLEALGCKDLKAYTEYNGNCAALIKDVINSVLNRVSEILANPIEEVLALIPEILYFINANGLGAFVQNFAGVLLQIVNEVLESGLIPDSTFADFRDYLEEKTDHVTGETYYNIDLDAIMTNLLRSLLGDKADESFTFSFSSVDLQFVIDMVEIFTGLEIDEVVGYTLNKFIIGVVERYTSASTTYDETYRVIFADPYDENGKVDPTKIGTTRADMITILLSLVIDLLGNEQNVHALVDLIGGDIDADTINAIVDLLRGGNLDEMIDIDWFYFDPDNSIYESDGVTEKDPRPEIDYNTAIATPERTINYIEYYTDWTKETADYLINNIDAIITEVLGLIPSIDATSVAELIAGAFTMDQLYNKDVFVSIIDAIQGFIDSYGETLVNAIGLIIGGDFSVYADIDTDNLEVNDRDSFIETLVTVLEPIYTLLNWFLFGEDMKYFYDNDYYNRLAEGGNGEEGPEARNLINLSGAEGYKYGLVPLLEALGVELPAFPASGKLVAGENFLADLLTAVFDRVEAILADPVNEVVALLPELLYFINAGGLTASVYNLLNAVVGLLPQISAVIAALGIDIEINGVKYDEIDVNTIVNDLLVSYLPENASFTVNVKHITLLTVFELVEAFTGLEITDIVTKENLRYFYFGELVSYDSGSGKTGFKMVYSEKEGKGEMLTILVNFIVEVLLYKDEAKGIDNVKALEELIGMDENTKEIVETIIGLISGNLDPYNYDAIKWNYFDENAVISVTDPETGVTTVSSALSVPTSQYIYLEYANAWTLSRADGIDKALASLVDAVLPLVMSDTESLSDLLNGYYEEFAMNTIFTADNLNTVLELLETYLYGDEAVIGQHLAEFAGLLLGGDITSWNHTYSFADYDETVTYITEDSTGLRYSAENGIKEYAVETEEDFINGLYLILQPASKLLAFILLGESYSFFVADQDKNKTLINIPGIDSYGYGIGLLLEALGIEGLGTSKSYNGDGAKFLKDLLTGLVNRIDEIIADPVNEVLDLIPELIYFINANGLGVVVNNIVGALVNIAGGVVGALGIDGLNDLYNDKGEFDPVNYAENYLSSLLTDLVGNKIEFSLNGVNLKWAINLLETATGLKVNDVLADSEGTLYALEKFVLGVPTKYETKTNFPYAYRIEFPETEKYFYRCDLITILLSFAIEFIENGENQAIVEDFFGLTAGTIADILVLVKERSIKITPDYDWFYFDPDLTFNGTDITFTSPERTINYLTYASNWSEEFADYLDDHLNSVISSVLNLAGMGDSTVADIIANVFKMSDIYTLENIETIRDALKDLAAQLNGLLSDAAGEGSGSSVIADALDIFFDIDLGAWDKMTFEAAEVDDKEGFAKAIARIIAPLSDIINWLFFGSSIKLFSRKDTATGDVHDIIVINGYDGYNEGLVPLLEALGVNLTDAKNVSSVEEKLEKIIVAVLSRAEEILSNPVDEVLALIPEILYFINSNGLAAAINHTLGSVLSLVDSVNAILKDFGVKLNVYDYDEIDINGILNAALSELLNKDLALDTQKLDLVEIVRIVELFTGLDLIDVVGKNKLDNFYLGQIVSYESANGKTLFKMQYSDEKQKDRSDMITVVFNFLVEAVLYGNNTSVIENMIGLEEGTVKTILDALATLSGESYPYDWNYFYGEGHDAETGYELAADRYRTPDTMFGNYLTYKSDWTKSFANDLYNNLNDIVNSILAMTGNENATLGEIINNSFTLYKGEYLNAIVDLVKQLYDVLDESLLGAIGAFLKLDLSYWKNLSFDETKTYSSTEFAAAIVEIVKPIYSILDWLFLGEPITLFVDSATGKDNLIVIPSLDAYGTGLVPILEALGVKLPAYTGEETCATEITVNGVPMSYFQAIVNAILARVDEVLADPINEALELLPELLYFINANGLSTAAYNMIGGVVEAANTLIANGVISLGAASIEDYVYEQFGIDPRKLDLVGIFSMLENLDVLYGLKLNDVFTVSNTFSDGATENILEYFYIGDYANSYASATKGFKGYKMSLSEENKGDLLTILLSIVLEVILYEGNEEALAGIIGGFVDGFTVENLRMLKLLLTTGIQTNPEMLNINWVYFMNYTDEELMDMVEAALNNQITEWPAAPNGRTVNALKYSNNWNEDVRDYLNMNLESIVDVAIAQFTDSVSLSDLLSNALDLWSSKDVNPDSVDLANLLIGYISNALGSIDAALVDTIGSLLGAEKLSALKNAKAVGLESKEDFVDFMAETLSPISPVLDFILFGGEYEFFTKLENGEPCTITLKGGEGYKYGLAPVLAALGVETDISAERSDVALREVLMNLVNRIDEILYGGDTINEALKLILNLVYFINANGLSISVKNILAPIDELLKEANDQLNVMDNPSLNGLITAVDLDNLNFNFIFDLVKDRTGIDIGSPIGDYLTGFYFGETEYFTSYGNLGNFRMVYTDEENRIDFITVIVTLLLDVIVYGGNRDAFISLIADMMGTDERQAASVVDAIVALLTNSDMSIPMKAYEWSFLEYADTGTVVSAANGLTGDSIFGTGIYGPLYTREMGEYISKFLPLFVDTYLVLLGVDNGRGGTYKGLDDIIKQLIGDNIYTNSILQTLADAITGAVAGLKDSIGDELFNHIANVLNASLGVDLNELLYAKVATITEGNQAQFIKALCDLLAPVAPILRWLLTDNYDIALFTHDTVVNDGDNYAAGDNYIVLHGADGYQNAIIPILEALCIGTNDNILTQAEFDAIEDNSALISTIVTPIFERINNILDDPINEIFNELPAVVYFLNSYGLDTAVKNLLNPIYSLLTAIEPLIADVDSLHNSKGEVDLLALAGIDLSALNANELIEMVIEGISDSINGFELTGMIGDAVTELTMGTVDSFESKRVLPEYQKGTAYESDSSKTRQTTASGNAIDYTMHYGSKASGGDQVDYVTIILRLLLKFISVPQNVKAIEALLKGRLNNTGYKFLCSLIENFSTMASTDNGMDKIMYTVYYIFYAALNAGVATNNGLANFNGNYSFLNQLFASSNVGFLRELEKAFGDLLNNYGDGLLNDHEVLPDGFIGFWQRIVNFFNKIINWFKSLFGGK